MRNTLLILALLFYATGAEAKILENRVYSPNIKSVQLFPRYNDLGIPMIGLNSGETLELHFDELEQAGRTYYYTIQQCRSNWEPTTMSPIEYLDGFTESTIFDYDFSNGTKQSYIHHRLEFPNQDIRVTKSGNYALIVYTDSPDEPLFVRRFFVVDQKVAINGGVVYPRNIYDRSQYQEVTFTVSHKGVTINQPQAEVRATVLQNFRWDNAKQLVSPYLSGFNQISFDHNGVFLFPSGREFRQFDLRSLRFRGQNIRAFNLDGDQNRVFLLYDSPQQAQKYLYYKDLSGLFYIQTLDFPNSFVNADYALVRFNLDYPNPVSNGNFYVVGAFNDWVCDEGSLLRYDHEDRSYYADVFLKQGFYNYAYVFREEAQQLSDQTITEGFYGETENDYTILIYYTPFGERYDQLIGVKQLNSILDRY